MVRRAVNVISPIAALAVIWASLQSFAVPEEPAVPPVASVLGLEHGLLPELAGGSAVLASASEVTDGATVPESVRRVLVAEGAVLLVPQPPGGGAQ